MGGKGRKIVRHEIDELKKIFADVTKEVVPTGRTKMICGRKINSGFKTE